MGVIWHKVWSDLWNNKGRTVQVVGIIAMGAFAMGMIIGLSDLFTAGIVDTWVNSNPAMIMLYADPPVDDDTLIALERVDGIEEVEGHIRDSLEWKLHPEDEWKSGGLQARADYDDQTYFKLELLSGDRPEEKVFAVGQGCDVVYGIEEGSRVYIRINDREHVVTIGGVIYDQLVQPPSFGGEANFYTTRETYENLTDERNFNLIYASAARYDEVLLTRIADDMQDKLAKEDVESGAISLREGSRFSDPQEHFFQSTMDAIFLIMGIMATVALVLGLLLVYNTVNAIITRQVSQIGMMKAIGATTWTILLVYLSGILAYGLMALVIAVPLGVIGAYGFNTFLLQSFNVGPQPLTISPKAVMAQVGIALLAPLLAALKPVFSGATITVREAISTYGLDVSVGIIDRLLARLKFMSRLVALTISNTFRNRERVFLTQITLVISGLIFMMVMSAGDSVNYTFTDVLFSILKFDVNLAFDETERVDKIEKMTLQHPGVEDVEMWLLSDSTSRPEWRDESEDDMQALVFGIPLPTGLYGPEVVSGRWLQPGDTYSVVLNEKLAKDVGVAVGDTVTLKFGIKGESDWKVVGLIFDPIITEAALVPREVLQKEVGEHGKANTVWIQTSGDNPALDAETALSLRKYYEREKVEVSASAPFGQDTAGQIQDNVMGQFAIIIGLLAVMAILIGAVGSVALSGALSLNVLERRREIGVMRAVGASSGVVGRMLVGEGLLLGWLSWLIALPLSIPAGTLMTQAVGGAVGMSFVYRYTPRGAAYWFVIISILSIVASLLPARGATRISVRESLAYE